MKISDRRPLRRGLSLPVFGLGCAQIGGLYRSVGDAAASARRDRPREVGIRYYDTAPYYGYTRSERRVGAWLGARPERTFQFSTKVGRVMCPDPAIGPGDDGWADPLPFRPWFDYTRDGVLRAFEDSLQRLGLTRVDLLFVHDIGLLTHGSRHMYYWEQLTRGGGFRALEELRDDGLIDAIGVGVNEWQAARAALRELDPDCTMLAGRYTLLEQDALSPFLEDCVARQHAVIVAGPFNSGILAGGETFDYRRAPPAVVERVRSLEAICRDFDVPLPAAALQFPLAHPAVACCVVGAESAAQVEQNVRWFEHAIPEDFWRELRKRAAIDAEAPLPCKGECRC